MNNKIPNDIEFNLGNTLQEMGLKLDDLTGETSLDQDIKQIINNLVSLNLKDIKSEMQESSIEGLVNTPSFQGLFSKVFDQLELPINLKAEALAVGLTTVKSSNGIYFNTQFLGELAPVLIYLIPSSILLITVFWALKKTKLESSKNKLIGKEVRTKNSHIKNMPGVIQDCHIKTTISGFGIFVKVKFKDETILDLPEGEFKMYDAKNNRYKELFNES